MRWLSENKNVQVGKVILVAPWLNTEKERDIHFFEFLIDKKLAERTESVTIFNSDNDESYIQNSVLLLRAEIENIRYVEFQNYKHFCVGDMKSEAFPELLEEILK